MFYFKPRKTIADNTSCHADSGCRPNLKTDLMCMQTEFSFSCSKTLDNYDPNLFVLFIFN